MSKPKVFVSRIIASEALDKIAEVTEMEVWPDELPPPYETLLEKAKDADGVVTMLSDRIDTAAIGKLPKLKVISNMAVGYDNIDIKAATARGIVVGYTPGVLTVSFLLIVTGVDKGETRIVFEHEFYHALGLLWPVFFDQLFVFGKRCVVHLDPALGQVVGPRFLAGLLLVGGA